ncbi:MAG: IclR family transcriptional regulator [Vicinamibacteria bacterium]|nr:IclR family transcriptional regulator [Vicinamibacteria bacterium]
MASQLSPGVKIPIKRVAKGPRPRKAYSSRLLDRSILLLKFLAQGPVEKRLSDFSEAGLHKSTALRLLDALRRHRFVAVDEVTGRYRLGLGLFELGLAAVSRLDVGQFAPPFLDALVAESGETASLGILEGTDVVYILRSECAQPLRLPQSTGRSAPAYCTGIGKAILAHMEPDRLETYLADVTLLSRTPRTLTDREALRQDLRRVRARGWSLDDEEIFAGLRCVAAPIFDLEGRVVAGVSVAGPTNRMPKDSLPLVASKVVATANQISRRLGHPGRAGKASPSAN